MLSLPIQHCQGMQVVDAQDRVYLDLSAALSATLGHRYEALDQALIAALSRCAGLSAVSTSGDWHQAFTPSFARYEYAIPVSSANQANEIALRVARSVSPQRHRVITLLGSDHGDTYLLRSASGRPAGQAIDGPVVAGFRHVSVGDMKALEASVDSQTAAIMISPLDWNRGGVIMDFDYVRAVEKLCREKDLLLIVDETRVPYGITGTPFLHEQAEISPDVVTASAGLTGGMPGGLLLLSTQSSLLLSSFTSAQAESLLSEADKSLPLITAAIKTTVQSVEQSRLLLRLSETADAWSAMLEDTVGGFDFVNDLQTMGLWTVLALDLPAQEFAMRAMTSGLLVRASGETTVLLCPPITSTEDVLLNAMQLLRNTLEALERETTNV